MQSQISKNSNTTKPITTIKELSKNLRQDCCYFVQRFGGLGDSYILCILKNELEKAAQGKVIFVVKPTHEAVFQMFEHDYIIFTDEWSVYTNEKILNEPIFKQMQDYKPVLGQFYDPFAFCLGEKYAQIHFENYISPLPSTRHGLLTSDKYIVPTNLPQIDKDLQARLDKIVPLDKIILFCPEANSCPDLPPIIFKDRCQRLREEGYFVIVNLTRQRAKYRRHFIDGVYDLNLSLKQSIALALSCAGVVAVRSGFCDVIVRFCKNLKLYQTLSPFSEDWLLNTKEEVHINNVPIYQQFLQAKESVINSLPLKLYQRYIAKGFLRRVRTPFTAYFKIYKNHKKQDLNEPNLRNLENFSGENLVNLAQNLQTNGEENSQNLAQISTQNGANLQNVKNGRNSSEKNLQNSTQNSWDLVQNSQQNDFCKEFLNDLAQTYEYQLGLLLEKACKGFWRGGFLAFPFAYLKLRKRKKTLTRLGEIYIFY